MQRSSRLGTIHTVTGTTVSQVTSAFGAQTYQVRAACAIGAMRFSVGAEPTATATDSLLPADTIDYITVTPGQKIATILQSTLALGVVTFTEVN